MSAVLVTRPTVSPFFRQRWNHRQYSLRLPTVSHTLFTRSSKHRANIEPALSSKRGISG